MPNFLNKRFIILFFTIAFIIFAYSNVLTYNQMRELHKANQWVNQTHLSIEKIEAATIAFSSLAPAERAYFFAGDEAHLKTYQKYLSDYNENIKEITALTTDSTVEIETLFELQQAMNAFLLETKSLFDIYQTGQRHKALEASLQPTYQSAIERVSKPLEDLMTEAEARLKSKSVEAAKDTRQNNWLILTVCGLGDFLLLITFLFFDFQIKERLKAEHSRIIMQNQLKGIIEGSNDLIIALTSDFKIIIFNSAYEQMFASRFKRHVAVGMDFKVLFESLPIDSTHILQNWERVFAGEEFTVTEPIGPDHYYDITFSAILDANYQQIGASGVFRDVTQRRLDELNLKSANQNLASGLLKLKDRYKEITLLNEMSEALQSCLTAEETLAPIKTYSNQILPFKQGALYLMDSTNQHMKLATTWGDPVSTIETFPAEQCWALRRNQIHKVEQPDKSIICAHVVFPSDTQHAYICEPLMAHNETLGLLYLEIPVPENPQNEKAMLDEHNRLLLVTTAEQISLALSNIKLRETLRALSIHDPLTGLYNRRFLEEDLHNQILRAERYKTQFAVVMIDIDHFKRFNDTYGHEAGDQVLKSVSRVFQDTIRGSDMICRYGGEEFVMILFDTTSESVQAFSERINQSVQQIHLQFGNTDMGKVTLSQGIAMYPDHGTTPTALIEAADKAMYQAKTEGRNRVISLSTSNS